jgi:hypothetical protein
MFFFAFKEGEMKLKTTYSIILALALLLANVPKAAAQKKSRASQQEAETQLNVTLVTDKVPSILQWKDGQAAARILSKIAVGLWKHDSQKARAKELFVSALQKCESLTGEDEKNAAPCKWRTINMIYGVDKDWYEELISQLKMPINPYSGVINELLVKGKTDEAVELIMRSIGKGLKEGLVPFLSQLRMKDPTTADQIFVKLLADTGQLGPDEVLAFSVYPGQPAGRKTVTGDNQVVHFIDQPEDEWGALSPQVVNVIVTKAVEARRDDVAKYYVMCVLLLPQARKYVPDLAQGLATFVNEYKDKFPELSNGLKGQNEPIMPENFDELLEKVTSIGDVRLRDREYAVLAVRALTTGKFEEAQKAVAKIDDKTIGSFGQKLQEWVDFALAGQALREDKKAGKTPDFGFAEKTAAKLSGAKSAWLWLNAGAGRRREGNLAQAKDDLMEALKAARKSEDKAPFLTFPLAGQFAFSEKRTSPLNLTLAWELFSEVMKSYDHSKPVMPGEMIEISGRMSMPLRYPVFVPFPPESAKTMAIFLALDKQKVMQIVSSIKDERTLGAMYEEIAAELLK